VTFLDSNVVIDLLEPASMHGDWARERVAVAIASGPVVTGTTVLAECAGHFPSLAAQLDYFRVLGVAVHSVDAASAYRAGLAHREYRRAGGERTGVLADFLIGGHALTLGATLLTRDRQRFATYFPELTLITPETHHG
jgi:predicted nucleic acid-binding protein